ncbi:MAG: prepilin peptidase [Frankiales bacterium]|nr:prepilin peptidase [Frankiales bacterium]
MAFLVVAAGVLGLLIGSFLNVVIHRVPRGESVVRPRSRCPRCGTELGARDNVPVVSWLVLRGRCRTCGEPISARYPLVELGTGLLFALTAWWAGWSWELPAYLYLAGIAVALAAIDLDVRRLPDAIVLPSYVVTFALLLLPAVVEGRWDDLLHAVLTGAGLFAFYFLLAFIYPAGMGFGDVKLAGVLGMYLGWVNWPLAVIATFFAFLIGSVVGVVVMVRSRSGRKTKVPFGPFMLLGTYLALLWGQDVIDWYTSLAGL